MTYVTSERLITRTHFARFLVEAGHAREMKDVFKRYLVSGKPGHVEHEWATMTEAIGWIHAAGGQAVLAHPARYKVDARAMRELLGEFRDTGGDAIEVVSPSPYARANRPIRAPRAKVRPARVERVRLPWSRRKLGGSRRPAVAARRFVPVWKDW